MMDSRIMIDLHCHILSGMDDGARSAEESLAMAEMAISDGITHVVATPHSNNEYRFDFAAVRQASMDLQRAMGDRLKLATGCDFHLSPENIAALKREAAPFCIHQKDCLLVEFNEFSIPPAMDQTIYEIQLAGLRPIITHPERNVIIRTQAKRLEKWIRTGGYGQVTGGSLTGRFGTAARQAVVRLSFGVSNRQAGPHVQQAEIFADDTKSVGRRAPPVRCVEVIFRRGADKYASATVSARDFFPEHTNPARVSFRGDNNYRGTALLIESLGDDMKLVRGVQDTRFQDANIAGTHPLFDQHHAAVFLPAPVRDMQTCDC